MAYLDMDHTSGTKRKRGRPAKVGPMTGQKAPTQLQPKKRGRPSKAEPETNQKAPIQLSSKSRDRPYPKEPVERDESPEPPSEERRDSRRRERGTGEQTRHYSQLAAVTREVSRHVIDTKWEPLPEAAVDRISQLLNEVERSVVMRLQDERKRTQASTAVQMVSRRLHRKLTKGQPFPPSSRLLPEEDFDFEKILHSSRSLEAQLTPMLHSIELLKAETAKEEALLEHDTTTLEALEANAKAEAYRQRKAERTLHEFLRNDSKDGVEDFIDSSGLVYRQSQQRLLELAKSDEQLGPVVDQLRNHIESIQSNINQIEGLASAIDGSRAAVQEVLLKHFQGYRD